MAKGLLVGESKARQIDAALRAGEPWHPRHPIRRQVDHFPMFWARIVAWTPMDGAFNRYLYTWEEVELNDLVFRLKDGGRNGGFPNYGDSFDYALNLCEAFNVADRAGVQGNSINQAGGAYPLGFSLQPVGGTRSAASLPGLNQAANTVVVEMRWMATVGGSRSMRKVFEYQNADDGRCT